MKLKTSFFNRGIFLNDLKRFGWIGVVYTLALLFTVPLQIFMLYGKIGNYNHEYHPMLRIFQFNDDLQKILFITVPVLVSLFLFRYLQVKESTDMIHTLPIKRSTLFMNHILMGKILLILPVLIAASVSWILNSTLHLEAYYTAVDISLWAGIVCVMTLFIFMFSTFVGVVTGNSIVQGVLIYILLLLPVGLNLLLFVNLQHFIYGFIWDYYPNNNIDYQSPIIRILELGHNDRSMEFKEIMIYILLGILLYFLSKFLYEKRKLEAASQSIAFPKLNPLFKYGVTFCAMLLGGVYFWETQNSIYWAVFGYIIGSLIGYFVAEMVLRKSLWVFRNGKGYFIYGLIMIVLVAGIKLDVMGYEQAIPPLEQVDNIYFNNYFYYPQEGDRKIGYYFDEANIQNIYHLHQQVINNKNRDFKDQKTENIVLKYTLKNGKDMIRGYPIPSKEYREYLKVIYESNEFKNNHYELLDIKPSSIDRITIHPNANTSKNLVLTNPDDLLEAVMILKDEIYDETYEDMEDPRVPWADIDVLLDDKRVHLSWKKTYGVFEEWLQQKGRIEQARIIPEDISYAVVEEIGSSDFKISTLDDNTKDVKRLDILDKEKIEYCLRNIEPEWQNGDRYILGFYGKDKNNMMYGSFSKESAPDFIKEYFQ